ncbi:hypothetical protein ABB02_01988 [Clostridiaceae bacterium JG1575]|nr:hypothetical protein ABB02_01988 [Clostridiaceae bacterium JG1575]
MLVPFLITAAVFLVLDGIWLLTVGARFYKAQLGELMAPTVNFWAAGVFYLIYLTALMVFVVVPALKVGRPQEALWKGALFGLAMYATYDLTNLAALRGWPLSVTLVDLGWGAFVTAATAFLATHLIRALS